MEDKTRNLETGLLSEEDLFLFTDYYELTSGKCNFDHSVNNIITETYFFREIPKHLGSYIIAAGLEQFIAYIQVLNRGLSKKHREWLEKAAGRDLSKEFLDYLENFRFRGDIYAVPEGTPVFPNEPVINITGPSIDVQLLETYLLNVINFESLVATKASRIVYAAKGRNVFYSPKTVVDFGARRAHGRDAAVLAARAAYIGGFDGTSLVIAAMKWGIPFVGTIPHKFIEERYRENKSFRETELQAFMEYAESFPHNTVLLVDTYDTVEGIKNAIKVGLELKKRGYKLAGIRLDSGDPVELSKIARKMFDEAGLTDTKIFASDRLDEFIIEHALSQGAPINGFGVGTKLVTGANYNSLTKEGGVSALDGIFKLAETSDENGRMIPTTKFTSSLGKATLPGRKQVWRRIENGQFVEDIITLWDEEVEGAKPLLVPIIIKGEIVYDFPSLEEIRRYCAEQLAALPEKYRRIRNSEIYPVRISEKLRRLMDEMFERFRREYSSTP
ncbi:MAG: nicotinate phosphoribosyltransferase [Candidatus Bathyarchaeia archaeon]|nr:nicotinate phosphoribosyltransferase [Candidatus Bathyarchaeota archaeon]